MGFLVGLGVPGRLCPGCIQSSGWNVFLCRNLEGPLWGQSEERLKEGDLTDKHGRVYSDWSQYRQTEGWTVLFLGPAGFFPAASVWGAVSPQSGLPQPPLTRVTLSFIILDEVHSRVERGPLISQQG